MHVASNCALRLSTAAKETRNQQSSCYSQESPDKALFSDVASEMMSSALQGCFFGQERNYVLVQTTGKINLALVLVAGM